MNIMTKTNLANAGICNRDRAIWEELYGEGGEVTLDRVMRGALLFDWSRCYILLTPRQRQMFRIRVAQAWRRLRHTRDKTLKRAAMANAFFHAYNGPR